MDLYQQVSELFHSHIDVSMRSLEALPGPISDAAELLNHCLLSEHKILCCGEGASGALSQLFAANLLGRYQYERPSLPAMTLCSDATSLTAMASDGPLSDIFARQIRALGQSGDILLLISQGSASKLSLQAIQAAHDRDMLVIYLGAGDQHDASALLLPEDIEIDVPTEDRARASEIQHLVINSLCDLIDQQLFGIVE